MLMKVHLTDINVSAEIDEYPTLRFQAMRKNQSATDGGTYGRASWKQYSRPETKVCICASSVKFHLLIHEIECTQGLSLM